MIRITKNLGVTSSKQITKRKKKDAASAFVSTSNQLITRKYLTVHMLIKDAHDVELGVC